jgi:retinol-binding protein 3
MKTYPTRFIANLLLACLLLNSFISLGQSDRRITRDEQKQIVDKAFSLLKTNYIFPENLVEAEKLIYKKLSNHQYAKYVVLDEFLKNINTDLETLTGDRHIDIFFDPVRVKQIEAESKSEGKVVYTPGFLQRARFENYLVRKVERLDGNIGYFKLDGFVDTSLSKETLMASMTFLANSSALIIDLRQNGGGDARTLDFLLAYFLADSTLISSERSRAITMVTHRYVKSYASVKKFQNTVPIYVLVGKRTSSAAEAFAYTLQSYKKGTIVGDTTMGEANPGYLFPINAELYIMIPAFESIHPMTKTNWQGKGVTPDVQIDADKALSMARLLACKTLVETGIPQELKSMYKWMTVAFEAELRPVSISENELKLLEGNFADKRHVKFANGTLYYYRGDDANAKKKLTPLAPGLFGVEGVPFFRIQFIKDEKGEVAALEALYDDGKNEESKKL